MDYEEMRREIYVEVYLQEKQTTADQSAVVPAHVQHCAVFLPLEKEK